MEAKGKLDALCKKAKAFHDKCQGALNTVSTIEVSLQAKKAQWDTSGIIKHLQQGVLDCIQL